MDSTTREMVAQVVAVGLNVILTLLLAFGGWALKALKDKFAAETTAAQQDVLRRVADQAVFYAEEWAARQKASPSGEDKRRYAADFIQLALPQVEKAGKAGVIAMDHYVHAALGARKGFGASKGVGADMLQ